MLRRFNKGAEHLDAIELVTAWTRTRFKLGADDVVMVTQVECQLLGCPPLETVIAFWTAPNNVRHHFKLFKPVVEVAETDLPPDWFKSELIDDGLGCECC